MPQDGPAPSPLPAQQQENAVSSNVFHAAQSSPFLALSFEAESVLSTLKVRRLGQLSNQVLSPDGQMALWDLGSGPALSQLEPEAEGTVANSDTVFI